MPRICKPFDFGARHTDRFQDLKLVFKSGGFCNDLSSFCIEFLDGDTVACIDFCFPFHFGDGDTVEISLNLFILLKTWAKELHLPNDFVSR